MPHADRPLMSPPPEATFDQVYNLLASKRGEEPSLSTRRGTGFIPIADVAPNTRLPDKRFISLPSSNRIYSCCWGNQSNHMGKVGQRIGQYAHPLDRWATRQPLVGGLQSMQRHSQFSAPRTDLEENIMRATDFEGELSKFLENYKYQPELTPKLDDLGQTPFTDEIINEIVLWKVNRYAHLDECLLLSLNALAHLSPRQHRDAKEVLFDLLDIKGVDIAMASTLLRFRNPSVFQIIDQHAYRAVCGRKLPYTTKNPRKVEMYFDYLDELIDLCKATASAFETIDRVLLGLFKLLKSRTYVLYWRGNPHVSKSSGNYERRTILSMMRG